MATSLSPVLTTESPAKSDPFITKTHRAKMVGYTVVFQRVLAILVFVPSTVKRLVMRHANRAREKGSDEVRFWVIVVGL
ncbi:unnamed protein product [Sphenostylis stenocarpa]|uniref:Uncharacterized protein n=1 Tax=Sphenostylis stenocarpa TaxID=92480 RepID=A0AA86S2U0_9FABA|nr:unnamed protein product [Sphenostylis stenocarpa]